MADARPFHILDIQQIAIGSKDKQRLLSLWIDLLGFAFKDTYISEWENVNEDICAIGQGAHEVEVDLMHPVDVVKKPAVHQIPLNHIGLWVDNLQIAHNWLSSKGLRFAPGGIRKGAAGHDIIFIHPKGNNEFSFGGEGALIELLQSLPDIIQPLSS